MTRAHAARIAALPLTLAAALAALAALLPAPEAQAGGWTQAEGSFYLKLWNRSLIGKASYFADGEVRDVESFQDHALNLYGEYGLTDGWTLVGFTSPIGFSKYDAESTTYVGPSFVGVRRAILSADVLPLSVEAHYGFTPPVGDRNLAVTPLSAGPDPFIYQPTISTHRADLELQVGYPIPSGWATLSAGGRYFTSGELDPVIYGNAQIGYASSFGLVAEVHAGLNQPLGEVTESNVIGGTQTAYLGIGLGVSYWITQRVGVNVTADGVAFAKSNAATPALTLGVELR